MIKLLFQTLRVLTFLVAIISIPDIVGAESIAIGSIGNDPSKEIRKFMPLADYLAKHLLPEGIQNGKVIVAKDLPQMASYLQEGKVDLYIDSPLSPLLKAKQFIDLEFGLE